MITVYISGPMTGYEKWNIPAFDHAAEQLRGIGFKVISPAEVGRFLGYHENTPVTIEDRRILLLADLEALTQCDAVFLLPGHTESRGAAIEKQCASYWGIPAFESISDLLVFREGKAA